MTVHVMGAGWVWSGCVGMVGALCLSPIADALPANAQTAPCTAPAELAMLKPALSHVAARVASGQPLTIVAVGSSSTAGVGASAPAMNYPSRLEAELKQRYPNQAIRVINRGRNGEDAAEELARLDRDVLAEHPDLVIWQVGTNAVLRRDDMAVDEELLERGLTQLRRQGDSDILLMDMQYAPRVLARPGYTQMEQVIAGVAKRGNVGLVRRFEIMRHWQDAQPADAAPLTGSDGLHMTDRGYGCLAAGIADAVAENVAVQEKLARDPASRVAGLNGPAKPPAADHAPAR